MKLRILMLAALTLLAFSAMAYAAPVEDGALLAAEDTAAETLASCERADTMAAAIDLLVSDTSTEDLMEAMLAGDVDTQSHCEFDPHCDSQAECTSLCGGRCFMNCCFCP